MAFKIILLVALTTAAICESRSVSSMESTEIIRQDNDLTRQDLQMDTKPVWHLSQHPRKQDETYAQYILRLNRIKEEQNDIMTSIVRMLRNLHDSLPKIEDSEQEIGVRAIKKKMTNQEKRRMDNMNVSDWKMKQRSDNLMMDRNDDVSEDAQIRD